MSSLMARLGCRDRDLVVLAIVALVPWVRWMRPGSLASSFRCWGAEDGVKVSLRLE